LPETDPPARQVTIGCGCFLELLMMALAEQGIAARLSLFPDGGAAAVEAGQEPFARIVLDGPVGSKDPLFAQVLKRRSTKEPYEDRAPSSDSLAAIRAAVAGFDVQLDIHQDKSKLAALKQIALDGWHTEMALDRTYRETVERMRIGADAILKHRDGVELNGPLFWWMRMLGLAEVEAQMRPDSIARKSALGLMDDVIPATPAMTVLSTASNDRMAQIAAGRAHVRMNLAAAAHGLSVAPISQVLQEFAEMRALHLAFKREAGLAEGQTPQMFLRLGYATPSAPTPRRPLDAILMS
jgi:nitroreductase